MKYIVSIDYKRFEFNDATTAMSFAELAVKYSMEYNINVTVEFVGDKE